MLLHALSCQALGKVESLCKQLTSGFGKRPRCDNITISPNLLEELEASHDPLPRKLWPNMGTKGQERINMKGDQEPTFRKLHGDDQMAVDKLQEGIDGFAKDQTSLEGLIAKIKG